MKNEDRKPKRPPKVRPVAPSGRPLVVEAMDRLARDGNRKVKPLEVARAFSDIPARLPGAPSVRSCMLVVTLLAAMGGLVAGGIYLLRFVTALFDRQL